jgi:hypothetical protein
MTIVSLIRGEKRECEKKEKNKRRKRGERDREEQRDIREERGANRDEIGEERRRDTE